MTKGDLMKLVLTKEQQGYCDSAIPKELWATCDTSLCVFDCRNNEIINLPELLVTSRKVDELVNNISDLEYKLNRKITKTLRECQLEKDLTMIYGLCKRNDDSEITIDTITEYLEIEGHDCQYKRNLERAALDHSS